MLYQMKLQQNMINPLLRGAVSDERFKIECRIDSSPPARGRLRFLLPVGLRYRFIPSCEGQTLSVYAAFSRLKHLVVQFAQILLSTRHTSFPLHDVICRKNIFFAIFPNIFFIFFQSSFHIHHPRQFLCLHLHSYLLCIFVHL